MRRRALLLLAPLALLPTLAHAAPSGPQPVLVVLPGEAHAALLGVWAGGRWLEGGEAAGRVRGGEGYRVQALGGGVTDARGARARSFGVPCPDASHVALSPPPRLTTFAVATTATSRARPRPVTVLPTTGAVYRAAVRDELVSRGLRAPAVNLTRVVRADLDGNGTDEVIVEARRFAEGSGLYPPPSGQPGDYSLLLLRHVAGNRVQTTVLGAYVALRARDPNSPDFGPLAHVYALAGVADLNGDGRMEVLTFGAYYEGYALTASEWTPQAGLRTRLETGCGA